MVYKNRSRQDRATCLVALNDKSTLDAISSVCSIRVDRVCIPANCRHGYSVQEYVGNKRGRH
jgi:hypothetical protein